MSTKERIEKKGYKVTFNMGFKNGAQTIVSVSASRGLRKLTDKNITGLLRALS